MQAKMALGEILYKKRTRSVYSIILNEREWLNVLTTVNVNGNTIPNYYIFKGIRPKQNYQAFYENGSRYGMHKKIG